MRRESAIEADARKRPELFQWNGPLPREELEEWSRRYGRVPEDLRWFWSSTGGGDVFESETLLSPLGDSSMGDDVVGVTEARRAQGLPGEWVVFHVGFGTSAFHVGDGRYAWFEGSVGAPSRLFDSLDDWYRGVLRAEYAERYGL